ncbi:atherin-like isoform X2 [Pteropus medius]|uniref:atherin-like isoform X2 n=1 Tax=Pteropus vampyrus TaxID=132908 RepID=UPI00196A2384|nr:atherin-like isoform X2 [Pteropus giganteus]
MAGPGCPPPPSRAGEGGRSGGHTESGSRGWPPAPPAVTIARLHAAAAAAALFTPPPPPRTTTTTGLTVPAPRSPPPSRKPRSHPRGEENARSPSLGVKLQHGFRLRRSSPSPYSRSSSLLPLFPAPARLRSRDPGPSAPRPRARPACARSGPARRCGGSWWPGRTRPEPLRPVVRGQKRLAKALGPEMSNELMSSLSSNPPQKVSFCLASVLDLG